VLTRPASAEVRQHLEC